MGSSEPIILIEEKIELCWTQMKVYFPLAKAKDLILVRFVRSVCREAGLEPRLKFLDPVPYHTWEEYVASADIGMVLHDWKRSEAPGTGSQNRDAIHSVGVRVPWRRRTCPTWKRLFISGV